MKFAIMLILFFSVSRQSVRAENVLRRSDIYLANFETFSKSSRNERIEYISFLQRMFAKMEHEQDAPSEARFSRSSWDFLAEFWMMMLVNNEAWAHSGEDHGTPKEQAPQQPPPRRRTVPPAASDGHSGHSHGSEPPSAEPQRQETPTRVRSAPAKQESQESLSNDLSCDPGKQQCCIHSGNFIPVTNGRCLGGSYIGCATSDDGKPGFQCNPFFFGQNEAFKMPFCVEKGPPHDYTNQCAKLGSEQSAQKYILGNKAKWTQLQGFLKSYCEGASVPKHNLENCETLKRRAESLGNSPAPSERESEVVR